MWLEKVYQNDQPTRTLLNRMRDASNCTASRWLCVCTLLLRSSQWSLDLSCGIRKWWEKREEITAKQEKTEKKLHLINNDLGWSSLCFLTARINYNWFTKQLVRRKKEKNILKNTQTVRKRATLWLCQTFLWFGMFFFLAICLISLRI